MEGVRRAQPQDAQRCAELLAAAITSNRGQRGAAALLASLPEPAGADALVARWMQEPDADLFVGTFDNQVVGLGGARIVPRGRGSVGRIECLYVEPAARSVGVGQAMVEGLLDWFSDHGCVDVDAVVLPGDRTSKQLLESTGFKARLLLLHRSLRLRA